MRARIYDKLQNIYYISEVYGIINRAGDWYVVDDAEDSQKVVLVEYLDFTTAVPHRVNIEVIDNNSTLNHRWIYRDNSQLIHFNTKLAQSRGLHSYRGCEHIWEAQEALVELLETGCVEKAALGLTNFTTKLEGWNYIETQADIDKLMKEYYSFHDSVLNELSYISGDYYSKEEGVTYLKEAGNKQVRVVFDNEWAGQIEMILLAPRVVHLIPGEENMIPGLYDASIFLENHMVYFCDSDIKAIMDGYEGTYFKAMGLMWRFIEKYENV